MSIKVTCAKCGARLVYQGSATMVRPCPKCQTPIVFNPTELEHEPSPAVAPATEEAIAADAAEEPKPQPVEKPAAAVTPKTKQPMVIVLVLGGLAAAFGGLMFLILCCAGIGIFLLSSDRKASLAADSKGQPYSAASDPDYGKGSSYTDYSPSYPTSDSSYSYSPVPDYTASDYSAAPSTSGGASVADERAATAPADRARREEEQRRLDAEYWAQRQEEEAAEAAAREEDEERYREAFREAQRQLQAFP